MRKEFRIRLVALLSLLVISASVFADNDKPISFNELPMAAQQIINNNFKGKKIALTTVETGLLDKGYDVVFVDGAKLEFDKKGHWTNIDCGKSAVPAALIPAKIASYVKDTYSGQSIIKIDKDNKEYEIELSNGLEITFNKNFKVVEIDN